MYGYIPMPPRVRIKNNGAVVPDVSVNWTAEQVDFTLRMLIDKIILHGQDGVDIKKYSHSDHTWLISAGSKVSVHISYSYVQMHLDDVSGSFVPSGYFWKDRAVKRTLKDLISSLDNRHNQQMSELKEKENEYKKDIAMKALFNAFPEAITQEFEKHVLESKDGKSEN